MRGKPLSLLLPWIKSQHCASEWRTKHPAALNDAHSKQNDEDVLQITKTEFSWNNWHRRSYSHTNCYLEEKTTLTRLTPSTLSTLLIKEYTRHVPRTNFSLVLLLTEFPTAQWYSIRVRNPKIWSSIFVLIQKIDITHNSKL